MDCKNTCSIKQDKGLFAVLRQCLFYIPIMFIMHGISGVHGLVMTQAIAEILTLSLAFCVFVRKKNGMTKEVVEKLEDGWQI